jgi:hypothetical protein
MPVPLHEPQAHLLVGAESGQPGDLADRQPGLAQQALRTVDPAACDLIKHGGGTGGGKRTLQGPAAHSHPRGDLADIQLAVAVAPNVTAGALDQAI